MFRMTIVSLSFIVVFNELIEFVFRVKVIVCPTVKSLSIYSHFPVDRAPHFGRFSYIYVYTL